MSESYSLAKGANIKVADVFGEVDARLALTIETCVPAGTESLTTDVSVLMLGDDGKVRSNDDMIFYNQPVGGDGTVELMASSSDGEATIEVDLAALPESVARILVAASIDTDGSRTFGDAEALRLSVGAAGETSDTKVVSELTGLTAETAVIFGELYRRDSDWKIRAVGQGYEEGLRALVTEFGVDVDDPTDESNPCDDEAGSAPVPVSDTVADRVTSSGSRVALARKRRPVAKLPDDWRERACPGLPSDRLAGPWRSARLFPTVGIKSGAEQEGRTTSVLLSVMEAVPEFGRRIGALIGAPRGRIETFTEVAFSLAGQDLRPDGIIRISRGSNEWIALVEVKTAKGTLSGDQLGGYIQLARSKGFDAVITVSCDLPAVPGETPGHLDVRPPKSVAVSHLSWEEIITEASLHFANQDSDRTQARIMEQFLVYAADPQSGMWQFADMGRHWVKVRNGIADGTLSANDPATVDVCARFDQLSRHLALQLTALTGQTVSSQIPGSPVDAVSRAKQLADSGELFGSLRVPGATGPVVLNANLARTRIACAQVIAAPRTGRTATKVSWLLRQLDGAPARLRITAHHLGSRTDVTSAILESVREDPSVLIPPGGRDIREFTITAEASMGSKRAASENGFVGSFVALVNAFHRDVTEVVKAPRQ